MNVVKDENIINKLKNDINNYINSLDTVSITLKDTKNISNIDILASQDDWLFKIQSLTEHALIRYNKIDMMKENFLYCNIDYMQQSVIIRLNNLNCKYKKETVEIIIEIPIVDIYFKENKKYYRLSGNIFITV